MHMHKVKISIEVYRKATIGVAHEKLKKKKNNVSYNIPTKRKKEDGDG